MGWCFLGGGRGGAQGQKRRRGLCDKIDIPVPNILMPPHSGAPHSGAPTQSTEFTLRPDQAPSAALLAFLRLLNLEGALGV